jgi:hypothetical protein
VEFVLVLDVSCPSLGNGIYQARGLRVVGVEIGCKLMEAIVEKIAELSLDLVMEIGFGHDVEIYRLGFVIVIEPPDLRLVEFEQAGVELLGKIVHLVRLPMEAEDRVATALARFDDAVEDSADRGNLRPDL